MRFFSSGDSFRHDFTVSEAVYRGFQELFEDRNPLHTDADFARGKGFAGPVMYGNILNGFLSYFIGELLPTKEVIIHSQAIQYRLPVYLNDRLTLEAVVKEIFPSVGAVEFKYRFVNQEQAVVAKGNIQIGVWE